MCKYFCRVGKSHLDGVEILRYRIKLPEFEDMDHISQFYRSVADTVGEFCESELREYAEREYATVTEAESRLRYRPLRYLLDGSVTCDDGETVFVRLAASLVRGDVISQCYDAHAWSREGQRMIPPIRVARMLIPKGKLPREVRRADGIYISEGRIYACRGRELTEIARDGGDK